MSIAAHTRPRANRRNRREVRGPAICKRLGITKWNADDFADANVYADLEVDDAER